ncbi:GNAT family N-acetyltransferase [Shewanella schlegeliana]|uniref:GNAT family N-acetyltransferase n=1 Tax=Shewanella schlegeliana TaxID=190308 RepID=A0ABS1SZX2_9GAMM|nr:GNAT family N-acetyltransferase [Shewanella schlegeliana]MBL4914083.1 GNAT family N-acetyltransferase [Shewanella schlegeliana]MCL1110879.1 GNAT family N-acetyltransferase [Shewanella schlegeliana]GIU34695.1 GCN5 family N-acetyltransferase [Shewanella schlegeliana]
MERKCFIVRPFTCGDVEQVAKVFHLSINQGASSHYSEAERAVWSPNLRSNEYWLTRLSGTKTWVAECDLCVVGFINLKSDDLITDDLIAGDLKKRGRQIAEVDCLFTLPDYIGIGVASELYRTLEKHARALRLTSLTVEASYLAKPFFEKFEFQVKRKNSHPRDGQKLVNFSMFKELI